MKKKTKILLINFGGIGDEILFLPTVKAVRTRFCDAEITLCTEKRSRSIENLTNLIDDLKTIDNTKNRYFELLKLTLWARLQRFDYIISSGSNQLIPLLLWLMGGKNRIGFSGSKFEKLLTKSVKLNKNQYAAEMYFDLVRDLTGEKFELPKIGISEPKFIENSVLIHPGVSAMSRQKDIVKTFSGRKWAKIIDALLKKGRKVLLAGGPDDRQVYEEIIENLENIGHENFVDYYGKTKNIMDLAHLINNSEVLCCSDSAPMHIGVALNKKVVAIFGPTDENKLIPQKENFIVIQNNCDCRPCLWDKRQTTCEKLDCLKIDVDYVVSKL
ncbi:glycosyltransferase family 9 protein [bacterium]|nr:glycosyltransferase family 9 protein [bacterium]